MIFTTFFFNCTICINKYLLFIDKTAHLIKTLLHKKDTIDMEKIGSFVRATENVTQLKLKAKKLLLLRFFPYNTSNSTGLCLNFTIVFE